MGFDSGAWVLTSDVVVLRILLVGSKLPQLGILGAGVDVRGWQFGECPAGASFVFGAMWDLTRMAYGDGVCVFG